MARSSDPREGRSTKFVVPAGFTSRAYSHQPPLASGPCDTARKKNEPDGLLRRTATTIQKRPASNIARGSVRKSPAWKTGAKNPSSACSRSTVPSRASTRKAPLWTMSTCVGPTATVGLGGIRPSKGSPSTTLRNSSCIAGALPAAAAAAGEAEAGTVAAISCACGRTGSNHAAHAPEAATSVANTAAAQPLHRALPSSTPMGGAV